MRFCRTNPKPTGAAPLPPDNAPSGVIPEATSTRPRQAFACAAASSYSRRHEETPSSRRQRFRRAGASEQRPNLIEILTIDRHMIRLPALMPNPSSRRSARCTRETGLRRTRRPSVDRDRFAETCDAAAAQARGARSPGRTGTPQGQGPRRGPQPSAADTRRDLTRRYRSGVITDLTGPAELLHDQGCPVGARGSALYRGAVPAHSVDLL
jgi:hypothetical protein